MSGSSLLDSVSPRYPYALIQQHDSWLAVDPVVGCKAQCSYCLLRLADWTGRTPELVQDVQETLRRLVAHRCFVAHETALCFGTRTDPLFPESLPHTIEFLRGLEERDLRNPVALVTRRIPSEELLDVTDGLRGPRVVWYFTYSGLPRHLEVGAPGSATLEGIRRAARRGAPVVHFLRPILRENSAPSDLQQILEEVVPFTLATVVVGLKVSPDLRRVYQATPELSGVAVQGPDEGTAITTQAWDGLIAALEARWPGHPLYRHTSCAMALALGAADYTATYHHPSICGESRCPAEQRARCAAASTPPTEDRIRASLAHLRLTNAFRVRGSSIVLDGEIGQEEYVFLLHQLRCPIQAEVRFFRAFRGGIFARPRPE